MPPDEVHVPAGTASLLVAAAPVFSVLLAGVFFHERIGPWIVAGSVVAVGGCAVIAFSGGDTRYSAAAWVVLGAAFVQGVYHAASKPLLRRYTGMEVACWSMWSGTALLLPCAPAAMVRPSWAVVFLGSSRPRSGS